MLICILTGFSSGLPLYLLLNLVPAWLKTEGLSLKMIGAFALIQFPYTWKFLWSPLLDRYALPLLGRRRGWMLVTQLLLIAGIALLGQISVKELAAAAPLDSALPDWLLNVQRYAPLFALTGLIAFLSATQDIVLDAFRRELLPEVELGLGNAIHVNAYKIAGLVPGSISLILADHLPWGTVFLITALFMLPGAAMSLFSVEPAAASSAPRTLRAAIVEPFQEFFGRHGVQSALLVLLFILLYKLGDSLCTSLATPFYLDMGFTKTQIGLVAKNAGLWPSVIGGLLGGLWMIKLGINRALWIFGFLQWIAILGFAWLAWLGPAEADAARLAVLATVIGVEAAGVGLGTTAFVAWMARTTHPAYTATQLALFTSLMAVPRTFINASAGWLVEALGWFDFFMLCTLLAVPGMLLLFKLAPWNEAPKETL
ncbi:AmpG family muropeptide MFS transporter [Uliginosibacterium sp. 31-16]|uniref:AmpG family muropeptide MFS transporter n=1 Tax=Uliginosibacterium sp. 31-16 TaxID=3068315 RepID=UPI00273E84D2|nr:AmpG family muropeptide MFS transporter [Uliginosibacterium sp. 31-16]MDP5238532.1 AmpG family muropeptide MFS transporter [Uliginosibacterium sp. 31-16]